MSFCLPQVCSDSGLPGGTDGPHLGSETETLLDRFFFPCPQPMPKTRTKKWCLADFLLRRDYQPTQKMQEKWGHHRLLTFFHTFVAAASVVKLTHSEKRSHGIKSDLKTCALAVTGFLGNSKCFLTSLGLLQRFLQSVFVILSSSSTRSQQEKEKTPCALWLTDMKLWFKSKTVSHMPLLALCAVCCWHVKCTCSHVC